MKAEVQLAVIACPAEIAAKLMLIEADLKAAGRIAELRFAEDAEITVQEVVLAPQSE